jgi:hypothetical protein
MKVRTGVNFVATLLVLFAAYTLAETIKEKADGSSALVTVTWGPTTAPGVVVVIRVAGKIQVAGQTFTKGPIARTYPVKRGDAVLVVVDPLLDHGLEFIECVIVVDGVERARRHLGNVHTVCGPVIT